jgi:RNA polymerase sigma-70 factor (ECF subfamily)
VTLGERFDEVLVAARTGAPWALEAIYRDLHPPVLSYLRARAAGEADDLAHDVFLAVARGVPRFQGGEERFRSWVFTIAYRAVGQHRRREGRRRTDPSPSDLVTERGRSGDAEDDAIAGLAHDAALARIAGLPPAQAEVLLLRIVADLSVDEVATIVGRKPGAVRALQHRALLRLARELSTEGP